MSLLLPYQQQLLRLLDQHQVVVCEKSRRIGMTWATAAYAVLLAARARQHGGMDALYIGYNLDMTREFMTTARQWMTAFVAAGLPLRLQGKDSTTQLRFDSGFAIKALSSHPRSLRGRQGFVILDEAAFHDDLEELLKAAIALQIWGGKVLVISTHNGQDNAFNHLINAIHSGHMRYGHLRVTFDDALAQGLYQRIHGLALDSKSSNKADDHAEAQQRWSQAIRDDYSDVAAEELDCLPRQLQGQYFAREKLERCCDSQAKVLRYACLEDDDPDHTSLWRHTVLSSMLKGLVATLGDEPVAIGVDFGRHHDLSVIYLLGVAHDLRRHTLLVVELRSTPFLAQWDILQQIVQTLPRVIQVSMDKGGNGSFLHEQAEQYFGVLIQGIQLSRAWYSRWMPCLRAAIEAEQISLPSDRQILDDLGQIGLVQHVPKPLPRRHGRHADAAIALALAYQASSVSHHVAEVNLGQSRIFHTAESPDRLML